MESETREDEEGTRVGGSRDGQVLLARDHQRAGSIFAASHYRIDHAGNSTYNDNTVRIT